MNIVDKRLDELQPYDNNPRKNDGAVPYVAESIRRYGFKVPIVIDKDGVIVAGHTRYLASIELGLETVPCIVADDLTDEQVREFRLVDNKVAEMASWDNEMLELELEELDFGGFDFGFPDLELDTDMEFDPYAEGGESGALVNNFIVPPFSVLDTRQGYWQERKRKWLELTGDLSETRDGEFGKFTRDGGVVDDINGGTSNFDPVLAEVMYKWFCIEGGTILDPFAGEQTKGVVAGELGYGYVACEIRQEQVDVDTDKTQQYGAVRYICGDSTRIADHIKERDFDMCFTSPPYYDLEVYSKDDLSSLGTYEEFMQAYKQIFQQCYDMLADDTFLVIKVGEIRNKKTGEYRSFVADNVKTFTDIGFKYYNELTLVHPAGTAPIRASQNMRSRKVVKLHQNVLVFYKGDLNNIAGKYPKLDFNLEE